MTEIKRTNQFESQKLRKIKSAPKAQVKSPKKSRQECCSKISGLQQVKVEFNILKMLPK